MSKSSNIIRYARHNQAEPGAYATATLNSIEQPLARRDANYYLLFLLPQAERNNNVQAQQNPR